MEIPYAFREIITGNMRGRTINNGPLGPQHIISSYNQKMVLNLSDYVLFFSNLQNKCQIFMGKVIALSADKMTLADRFGTTMSFNVTEAVCVVKF